MMKFTPIAVLLLTSFLTWQCKSGHNTQQTVSPVQLSERLSLIKMTDLNGKPFTLHRFDGKPVLLNFWATWCGPCVSEMNSLEAVYQQYKGQVEFVCVSSEPMEKIKAFQDSHDFHFEFAHLDIEYIDAYVVKLPTSLLIDRNGKLVTEEEGYRDWTLYNNLEKIKALAK
ncbi:MAG: TlpA family protein disulfide reductase [Lewinellaceae bacterium]|nr:TlpA family protein disulfide reductase [Lewinellaceae bacterium]